ncbi:MAG: hypothetical protein ACI83N_001956 [Hydrogenophaga sp.]|jgi:hypothetical protein
MGVAGHRPRGRHLAAGLHTGKATSYKAAVPPAADCNLLQLDAAHPTTHHPSTRRKHVMGKYFTAWLLGVPAAELPIVWFI